MLSIAAIVPVYNRATVVLEALDSIARQSLPPRRLVVVDDGSTDHTAAAVERWLSRGAMPFEATLLRQPNQGAAMARNHGAAAAAPCDLFAFLDSDDLWPPDYLQRMHHALAEDGSAVAASCDRINVNFHTGTSRRQCLHNLEGRAAASILSDGAPGLPNTVIRAADFERCGGFAPVPCYEDYHLMLRLSLLGRWRHVRGEPVLVRRNLHAERSNCEIALSKKFADRSLIAARVIEQFLLEEGGAADIPAAVWRRRLANLWCRAGLDLLPLGRRDDAIACFRQAVRFRRFHLRARWHSLRLRAAA
jgi:glycosyltransferase involved in cell wall biosynthesis